MRFDGLRPHTYRVTPQMKTAAFRLPLKTPSGEIQLETRPCQTGQQLVFPARFSSL